MELKDLIQIGIALVMTGTLIVAIRQLKVMSRQMVSQQEAANKSFDQIERQIKLLADQTKYQYEWSRKSRALEYSLSRNKNLQEMRQKLDKLFENIHQKQRAIPHLEIETKLEQDEYSYTVVTSLLAHWENLALAIHKDIVDEDVAFEMTAGLVIDYVRAFEDFIEERRKQNNDRAYNYLIPLAARWKLRLKGDLAPEKIFPRVS